MKKRCGCWTTVLLLLLLLMAGPLNKRKKPIWRMGWVQGQSSWIVMNPGQLTATQKQQQQQ
jgi:hypothetical protein